MSRKWFGTLTWAAFMALSCNSQISAETVSRLAAHAQLATSSSLDTCLAKWGLTYEHYVKNLMPHPIVTAYKWRVERDVKFEVPATSFGNYQRFSLKADGEFEITDTPSVICSPSIKGTIEGQVAWVQGPFPNCTGGGTGTYHYSLPFEGIARTSVMLVIFDEDGSAYQWTQQCFGATIEHESDAGVIQYHTVTSPYDDSTDIYSHPSLDLVQRVRITAECPLNLASPSPMVVAVDANMPPVTYDHTLGHSQIKALKKGPVTTADNAGLTRVRVKPNLAINYLGGPPQFGSRVCLWVHQLGVDISYPAVTVYVASEYPVGSCNYIETLAHEQKHVKWAKDLLTKYQSKLLIEIRNAPIPYQYLQLPASTTVQGEAEIEAIITESIAPIVEDFKTEIQDQFNLLDSPAEYQKVYERCPTW